MQLYAPDSIERQILLICGGVAFFFGLWLLRKPRGDQQSAKFDILGLKFESA